MKITAISNRASRSRLFRRGLVQSTSRLALTLGALTLGALAAHPALAQSANTSSAAPSDTRDIVVTGKLNQKESLITKRATVAEISVITADEITDRPVANVVDAISILPGVSTFADNGKGQATTGNPEFITIRGLDSSFNAYELNGVRVPTADPSTRAVSLKQLPPFGLASVQVVKAPTADYDGDAIGGVVDIRTPTAFDFAGPLAKITLQGNLSGLAKATGFSSGGGAAQLELARRFSDDRFGVYLTGYYQRSNSVAETTEVSSYAPTFASEANINNYNNVSSLTANQFRWDFYTHQITTYGGNLSFDYRTEHQTAYLKLTVSQYDDQGTDNQTSIRHQRSNTGTNSEGQVVDYYGQVVGAGQPGFAKDAPQQTNLNPSGTNYDANGIYDPNGVMPGHYFQLRDQVTNLVTVKFGGSTDWDRLSVAYEGSYGYNVQRNPNYVEGSSYGLPDATGRYIINSTAGGTPSITFDSPATQSYLFSQSTDHLWKFQGQDIGSEESLFGGKIDATYRMDNGPLKLIHVGFEGSGSERLAWDHQFTANGGDNFDILTPDGYLAPYFDPAGPTVANQPGQNVNGAFLGYGGVFHVDSRGTYINSIYPFRYQDNFAKTPQGGVTGNPGVYTANDYNNGSFGGTENIYSGYVSLDLQWGNLHAYPGLRYEYTEQKGYFWNFDAVETSPGVTTGAFQHLSANYGEVLPSLNVVYRPDNGLVFRGSLRKSFSRPAFGLIFQPASYTYNPDGTLNSISEGNPNLKPTEAINVDASVEYYGVKDLFLEAAFYNKQLSNFIYTSSVTGGTPQAPSGSQTNGGVVLNVPENGKSGTLTGLELSATERFSTLPGLWRGLGLNINGTFQTSEADSGLTGQGSTPLPHAPKLIYNLQLLYDLKGAHAALTYQYQGLQLYNLEGNLLNEYLQPTRTLNLTVGYKLAGWDLVFGVRNLTDSYDFYKTLGESTKYLGTQDGGGNGAYVKTGRFYNLSLSYKF